MVRPRARPIYDRIIQRAPVPAAVDARRRALVMIAVFLILLALHLWLLYRMVAVANWLLAGLLLVAIGLFGWRLLHYHRVFLGAMAGKVGRTAAEERRQMRIMAPTLVALLGLHAWLITITVAAGETLFTVLLLLAVTVFVARLVFYAREYPRLRGVP